MIAAATSMINTPTVEWWSIAPELVLGAASIVVLLVAILPSAFARSLAPLIALVALVAAAVIAAMQFDTVYLDAFSGQVDSDQIANAARLLAAAAGAATVLYSLRARPDDGRDGEHYALILAAVCGMGLFAAAGSLVSLFVGLELFSIALYVLCALEAERVESLESGLKYLIIGGLSSAVLLYGSALVYGATGSMDLAAIGDATARGPLLVAGAAMVLAALAFKASVAPLHWWTPDVYDGAPTTITSFMATATKAAAFLATARVLIVAFHPESSSWEPIVAGLAVTSIVVGNLGALVQQRIKRMLAYSSIAHAGYLLIGIVAWEVVGVAALVYALAVYVVMTLGAFALVLLRERQVGASITYDDLAGLGWSTNARYGWLSALPALAMVIFMLSLAGIPPTSGFFAKFGLFDAAVDSGYAWLAIVGVLGSAVSLAYYLRVPVAMYMQAPPEAGHASAAGTGPTAAPQLLPAIGVALAIVTMLLALPPASTLDSACDARQALLVQREGIAGDCGTRVAASRR